MKGGDCDKVHFELSRWESTAIPKLLADLFLALLCRQIHRLLRRNLGGFGAREWARVDPPSCKWPDQQISGMETLRGPWHSLSILEYLHHLGVPWQDVGFVWIAPYDTTAFETPQVWLKGLNPIHKIIQVSGNIPVTKKQVVPRTHEDTFCIMIIHDTQSTTWDKVYKVNKKTPKSFQAVFGKDPKSWFTFVMFISIGASGPAEAEISPLHHVLPKVSAGRGGSDAWKSQIQRL